MGPTRKGLQLDCAGLESPHGRHSARHQIPFSHLSGPASQSPVEPFSLLLLALIDFYVFDSPSSHRAVFVCLVTAETESLVFLKDSKGTTSTTAITAAGPCVRCIGIAAAASASKEEQLAGSAGCFGTHADVLVWRSLSARRHQWRSTRQPRQGPKHRETQGAGCAFTTSVSLGSPAWSISYAC